MTTRSASPSSPYLARPPRSIYDSCRALGRDDDGKACATCPVSEMCAEQRLKSGEILTLAA